MVFEILDMGHGNHDMHHSKDGFEYEFQPKTESGATLDRALHVLGLGLDLTMQLPGLPTRGRKRNQVACWFLQLDMSLACGLFPRGRARCRA